MVIVGERTIYGKTRPCLSMSRISEFSSSSAMLVMIPSSFGHRLGPWLPWRCARGCHHSSTGGDLQSACSCSCQKNTKTTTTHLRNQGPLGLKTRHKNIATRTGDMNQQHVAIMIYAIWKGTCSRGDLHKTMGPSYSQFIDIHSSLKKLTIIHIKKWDESSCGKVSLMGSSIHSLCSSSLLSSEPPGGQSVSSRVSRYCAASRTSKNLCDQNIAKTWQNRP